MKLDYEELEKYPPVLNKEQFRVVCHISKRTALYLLQSGLVKARNTGKKTHSWLIRKEDIISFAEEQRYNPYRFAAPDNWYIYKEPCYQAEIGTRIPEGDEYKAATAHFFRSLLKDEHDLLIVDDITRITGYSRSSVIRWIRSGHLKTHPAHVNKFYIPKIYLFQFLCGGYFNTIREKNTAHLGFIKKIIEMVDYGNVSIEEEIKEKTEN